jgi:hypothetical protein
MRRKLENTVKNREFAPKSIAKDPKSIMNDREIPVKKQKI